jgi:hypothetical protein
MDGRNWQNGLEMAISTGIDPDASTATPLIGCIAKRSTGISGEIWASHYAEV